MLSVKILVRMRKERKLNQEGVAWHNSLATMIVSKLEEENSDSRRSTVRKLAKALGCSVEVFFSDDSELGRSGRHA